MNNIPVNTFHVVPYYSNSTDHQSRRQNARIRSCLPPQPRKKSELRPRNLSCRARGSSREEDRSLKVTMPALGLRNGPAHLGAKSPMYIHNFIVDSFTFFFRVIKEGRDRKIIWYEPTVAETSWV